jgi:hypothetical protein
MAVHAKAPPPGGDGGALESSFPGRNDYPSIAPKTAPAQENLLRNPAAFAAARRGLQLEFLHECAGGIRIHAELVQTFAEIGDTAGACYSLKRLFAHARAAHSVFVELRDEARRCP